MWFYKLFLGTHCLLVCLSVCVSLSLSLCVREGCLLFQSMLWIPSFVGAAALNVHPAEPLCVCVSELIIYSCSIYSPYGFEKLSLLIFWDFLCVSSFFFDALLVKPHCAGFIPLVIAFLIHYFHPSV